MRAYGEAVFGYCMRMVRVHALAQELTQQVFTEAYRDFDRFKGHSPPRAWLFGIARHRCIDAKRLEDRRTKLIEDNEPAMLAAPDPGPSPIDLIDHAQQLEALEECLQELPPEIRETVHVRFKTNLTYEEMENVLEAKSDALQARVTRALQTLRKCLKRKGWSGE